MLRPSTTHHLLTLSIALLLSGPCLAQEKGSSFGQAFSAGTRKQLTKEVPLVPIKHPTGGKERAGLLVRGGNFLRLTHMQHLADLWWLRSVHSSVTPDNIGLMETMDHGTASAVDRPHAQYRFEMALTSAGFNREAAQVLGKYQETLAPLLEKVARGSDRARLEKLDFVKADNENLLPAILQGMFDRAMTRNALLHAGFSEKDAAALMGGKHRRAASGFFRLVWSLANEKGSGKHEIKGPGTAVYAAQQIMARKTDRAGDLLVLNRVVENGVVIEELSSGKRDYIRVTLAANPMKLKDAARYGMHFTTGDSWADLKPTRVNKAGQAVFELEVTGKAPAGHPAPLAHFLCNEIPSNLSIQELNNNLADQPLHRRRGP